MNTAENMASERDARLAALVTHLQGCPATRVEAFKVKTPAGQHGRTIRCIECGAQTVNLNPEGEHRG